jgi:uncharacterized membrane protein
MFPSIVISLFGILAAVSWGTADFFAAKASRINSPGATALAVSVIGTLAFMTIYLLHPGNLSWSHNGILYASAAGISLELGLFTLFRGLDAGPVSVVSPISSAYPIMSALVAVAVFGIVLRPLDVIGIVVTVVGITIASGILNTSKSEKRLTSGVFYSLATFILWGLAYALLAKSVTSMGWQKSAVVDTLSGLVALVIVITMTGERKAWHSFKSGIFKDKYVLGTASAQLLGGIVFTFGLAHARSTTVLTTIAATYPALTILLAIKHLNEKKQLFSIAGAFITMMGVIILSFAR